MTETRRIEGYDLIQSPEVSSSSDVLFTNFNYSSTALLVHGRRTYRRINPTNDSVHMPIDYPLVNIPQPDISIRNSNDSNTSQNGTDTLSTRTALICVALIFVASIFFLLLVYASFPELTQEEIKHIKLPWNIEEAKQLGIVLDRYKDDNYFQVLGGIFITYIFLQTFAIPGSLFLSILSGFLFNFYTALILVCTCSAIGASLCFLLSQLLGRKLVLTYFPERAKKWAVIVNKQHDNLFNYVVFLRITPFLPNWFINLTAPVIGVPLKPFALGTFFGVAPPSFVAIQAGQTLHEMTTVDSAFSWTSMMLLGVFAVVSLIPIFLKQRLKDKFD